MVSHSDVNRRLRDFICVRMDWDQMQRHRGRWATPTQGNQVLLDPNGDYIEGTPPRGKRYPIGELLPLLDRALYEFPGHAERKDEMKLEWFWCNPKSLGYPGHFDGRMLSRLDRKPLLTVSGPVPEWLRDPYFLRRHLRQFIWERGDSGGEPKITIRQFDPDNRVLLELPLRQEEDAAEATRALDRTWLEYMRVRPFVARGYIDNAHGQWLKSVMERAHAEELRIREEAKRGTLRPPGRETSR